MNNIVDTEGAASQARPLPAAVPTGPSVKAWLASHCQHAPAASVGAVVLQGTHGMRLVAIHPASAVAPAWVGDVALEAVTTGQPHEHTRAGPAQETLRVVAHPLRWQGSVLGASVLVLGNAAALTADARAALVRSAEAFLGATPAGCADTAPQAAQTVLRVLLAAAPCASAREAAVVMATTLAGLLDCDRISVGIRDAETSSVLGSSDGWEAQASSLLADATAAMDEALDEGATVLYPMPPDRPATVVAAHAHLSNARESRALCSVPLAHRGTLYGTLLAERRHAHPFAAADIVLLEKMAEALGPWLAMRRRLDLHWIADLRRRTRTSLERAGQGRHRLAALATVGGLALLLGWPIARDIRAPVKLEGAVQRLITSPGDSYLQRVAVRPGDAVRAGQVLVEFADEELRVERERLVAELGGHQAAAHDAMAKEDLAMLAVRSAKMAEAQAQLALVDQRLARARVVAPFDAIVIQGDLSNALGSATRKGDLLMTLAPADAFRAIVEVDDADIGEVRPGQPGNVLLTALPHHEVAVRVKRVTPVATTAQGRSFFEVEVDLDGAGAQAGKLRPGMRGMARLHGGQQARGLVWLDAAASWCRITWWRWIG